MLIRATIVALVCVAFVLAGCGSTAEREGTAAAALVDSVAALPTVAVAARREIDRAKAALAKGDSLLAEGDDTSARERFAATTVLARLAVVVAEMWGPDDTSATLSAD